MKFDFKPKHFENTIDSETISELEQVSSNLNQVTINILYLKYFNQ
jgi:hypothetical protein